MKELLKKLVPILGLIPLVVGTIGYLMSGEMLTNALYASFALYFTNPISDAYNVQIEFARWMAPLVTATAILCALQQVWNSIYYRIHLLGRKDSVAVYSDDACRISFDKNVGVIYPGDVFKGYAKSHIIMFSSAQKSMQFYEQHKNVLAEKDVFIGIKDMELGLLDEPGKVELFDINSSIARLLWKDAALWNSSREQLNVVVYGNSSLAGTIVASGLQLNLFSLKQQINYHFVTDNKLFYVRHEAMPLMNADTLAYYATDDLKIWNIVAEADVVIIADIVELELLQTFAVKARDKKIYYYSPNEGDLAEHISFGTLRMFGRMKDVFTDENIRQKGLLKNAIALHAYYAEKYGTDAEWNGLSCFLKASNISAADYGEVIASIAAKRDENELAELEHIRWSRFHFLNYYMYGVPESGTNKDAERRIHKDLLPYHQLQDAEKQKDIEAIRVLQKGLHIRAKK